MVASVKDLKLGHVFPRRVGRTEWTGGEVQLTFCKASKQIVIRQGAAEISIPLKRWKDIEELAHGLRAR